MKKSLASNIWKYTIFLIANKRIYIAILGAYYLTIPKVGAEEIGIILLAGSLAGFIFEIPSGYLSDKIGHKTTLVLSRGLLLLSTGLFLFADNVFVLILGSAFMSVAHAFHSGTGSAFMFETLKGLGRESDYARVTGKIGSIGFAIPIVFMVLTPLLVEINFKAPFVIALVVDLVGLLAAISLMKPPVKQKEIDEIKLTNFKQVIKEGARLHYFPFALFSGIVSGALITVAMFRAPYQVFLDVPVIWFGVLFGIGRVFASLMIAYSGRIRERVSLFNFLKIKLALYVVLILILGIASAWWVVVAVFIIINAFQWGLSKVDNSYLIDVIKTSKFKATLLSTRSQIDQIFIAVSSVTLGIVIERFSYQHGFLFLGIILFAVLFVLYTYIITRHRNVNKAIG